MDLPNELVREVKLRAVNEGKRLQEVVAELLRLGLGQAGSPPAARRGTIAEPFFPSVADAPAARMSLAELTAVEYQALTCEVKWPPLFRPGI